MKANRDDRRGEEFRDDTRRKGLPPELVRGLCQLNPWKASYAVAETFGVIAVAVAAAIIWWHPLVVVAAIFLIATRQQALFVLAHDAAHYRLYRQRWLNDLVGRVCGSALGLSMCTYRVVHRLHHNHLYQAQDPDIPLHGGYPRGRRYLANKLLRDFAGLTAWKTYAYFFGAPALNDQAGGANRPLDDTSERLRRQARQDRWSVVCFHLAALAAAGALGYGVEYLLLWILPLVTVLQPILRLRAICEHGAVPDLTSPTTASRTNLGPGWLLWLFFPHHVHYHIEHHLYPAVPHYNLKACHDALAKHGILEGAEVRQLGDTLKRVFAAPESAAAR